MRAGGDLPISFPWEKKSLLAECYRPCGTGQPCPCFPVQKHPQRCSFLLSTYLSFKHVENYGVAILSVICHAGCRQPSVACKMVLSFLLAPTTHNKSNCPSLQTCPDLSPSSTWWAEMLLAPSLPADHQGFFPLSCNSGV